MDYNEIDLNVVERELKAIVGHFANDVDSLYVCVAEDARKQEYLKVGSSNIKLTPCVFKSLRILGEGYLLKDENNNDVLSFSLSWRWEYHNGGSNGADLIRVSMFVPDSLGNTVITAMRF